MLDKNVLSKLSQLKSEIVASKEYATGTVAGTNGRYGFVKTDDGRDAFLAPEKMDKLLPGDQVKVSLITNDKGKLEATLEEFISCPTDRFLGTYREKGSAHFIQPDIHGFNRWVFLPPQNRGRCKEGDKVVAFLTQHPKKDGKAQAKVLERIGRPDDDKIEFKYTKAKYNLNRDFSQRELAQAKGLEDAIENADLTHHADKTEIPFVTIDSVNTRDMDDALAIEKCEVNGEQGYKLLVAIADPTSFVEQNSPIARAAQQRSQTVYMLGGSVPMIPTPLSNSLFSLEEGKPKLAMLIEIHIDNNGEIVDSHFSYAKICSKHKLNYDDVTELLEQGSSENIAEDTHQALQTLHELAQLRLGYRTKTNIVGQPMGDFDYQLNASGKIESIKPKPKTAAHRLVEEAMVATNICAGELLAKNNLGMMTINEGFRKERLGEVKALLKEENLLGDRDIEQLEDYKSLFKEIETSDNAYIAHPLRRMTQFGRPSTEAKPHMGMGLPHYATVTSPIRRYADLYNHWALKNLLLKQEFSKISDTHMETLSEALQNGKSAERELFQSLIVEYVEKTIGSEAHGRIKIVTQQGFGVRIDENGIEGFVLFPKKTEKKYDAKRMTLTVDNHTYRLDDTVKVKVASVDKQKRRVAFDLV